MKDLREIIEEGNLNGYICGIGIASCILVGYFTFNDMKEKGYEFVGKEKGIENIKEMFKEDTLQDYFKKKNNKEGIYDKTKY